MGLTIKEFKQKVTDGGYTSRSHALKAIPRCDWKDIEKHQVRNWLDKALPAEETPDKEAPKKTAKKAAAPKAKKTAKKAAKKETKAMPLKASKPRATARKTNGAPSSQSNGFEQVEKYLGIVERVDRIAKETNSKELKGVVVNSLRQCMHQLNDLMSWNGKSEPAPTKVTAATSGTVTKTPKQVAAESTPAKSAPAKEESEDQPPPFV